MGDLAERIRLARQKLNNVSTRVTREDGVEVTEARSADGHFTVVAEEEDYELATVDEEHEDAKELDNQKGQSEQVKVSNRRRKKVEHARRCGFVIDLKPDLQVAAILEGIYLSSQDVAHDFGLLRAHGVTHIVNAATGITNCFPKNFVYLNVDVLDLPTADLRAHFRQALPFMRMAVDAGGKVLVHCNAGVSRSATLIIAYLMLYHSKSLSDALQHVKSVRPAIRPNDGFIQQLTRFEEDIASGRCCISTVSASGSS